MTNEKLIELFTESVKEYLNNKEWHENSLEALEFVTNKTQSLAVHGEVERACLARRNSFQFISGIICGFASTVGLSNKEAGKRLFFDAGLSEIKNLINNP